MRSCVRIGALVGFVLSTLALAAGAVGAQELAAPELAVSPDSALQDGDVLEVEGTGFEPNSTLYLMLCNDDERLGDEIARCSLIGEGAVGYQIGEDGVLAPQLVTVPVGQVGASEMAVCPPTRAQLQRGVTCTVQAAGSNLALIADNAVTYEGQEAVDASQLAFTGPHSSWLVVLALALLGLGLMAQTTSVRVARRGV